jgi:penicillin-insensitive murein endopeptidase
MATPSAPTQTDEKKEEPQKPGTVVRSAKRIGMKLSKTEWQDGTKKLNLKANVQLDGKPLGEVEFEGTRQDSKIVLNPKNPELQDKLKAQLNCLSEETTCNDFFIDVFYREKDVLYHDQVLSEPKKEETKTPDTGKPSQENTTPPAPKKHEDESFAFIDPDATRNSGFAGSSDAEAWELYGLKVPPGSEPVPDSSTDDKKGEPPVQPPTPAPVPVPEGDKKGDEGGKSPAPAPNPTPAPTPHQPPPSVKPPIGKNNGDTKDNGSKPKGNPAELNGPLLALETKFKSSDQVINKPFYDKDTKTYGHLDRGINFRDVPKAIPDIGFQVAASDATTFGSYGLVKVLAAMAQALHDILPGRVLYVTSVSKQGGGPVEPHDSHQNGTDMDIRYLRNNENGQSDIVNGSTISSNFLVKQQWELMKKTFQTGNVDIVFMDRVVKKALCDYAISIHDYKRGEDTSPAAEILKRIQHVDGHENHFHVRTKCIPGQDRRCGLVKYLSLPVGC